MHNTQKKLLIIQSSVAPYRIPFFESLCDHFDVSILYVLGDFNPSGRLKAIKYSGSSIKIGGVYYVPGLLRIAGKFDSVVILFDIRWLQFALLPFKLKKGINTILWGHGIGRTNGFKVATWIRKIVAGKADALVFYTEETKQYFIEKTGVSEEKCFVAPNTLEVKNHAPNAGTIKKYILYLGRVQVRKKVDELLRAYALLDETIKEQYKLLIVGEEDMELRGKLQLLSTQLNIEGNVVFAPGTYNGNQVKKYYEQSLVSVSPGPAGLAVVHSFAYGVPFVTRADIRHGPEYAYCNDGNSYLYYVTGFENEKDAVTALQMVLELAVKDRELWLKKAGNAYTTYERCCSMEHMTAGFVSAINYAESK